MCKVLTGYFFLIENSDDDADTTGAIYGRLARAYYGKDGMPERWQAKTAMKEPILTLAENMFQINA